MEFVVLDLKLLDTMELVFFVIFRFLGKPQALLSNTVTIRNLIEHARILDNVE